MDGEVPEYRAAGMGGDQDTLTIDDYYFTHELLEVLRHDDDDDDKTAASSSTSATNSSNMADESEMASWLCEIFNQHDYHQSAATAKSAFFGGGSSTSDKPGAKAGGSGGAGRGRRSSSGKAAEQRRRDKINDKMRTLQQLMPTCTKTDKASTLEEVIQYIKSLQHQMQVLSNGYGLPTAILPPSGMRPTTCMQLVGDTFGGQVASVALSPYPMVFACPQYSNSVPLALPSPVLHRHKIGSAYATQQLAHRRHLVSPSHDLFVPTSHGRVDSHPANIKE